MSPQSSIAHYRVTTKLGEGGMGAVYRATDTKLGRQVAIKVLPAAFASDSGRMARFEREAKVLASLNHPNIAAIYGVEEHALIMELVEGDTLSGPLPIDTALDYARQIAAALDYAHEKGVVHRDLKPANMKVTPEGAVKVLDFGLAKAVEHPAATGDATVTLAADETEAGVILGSAPYMAPEQARGRAVDKRADIWSFGVVLYELLTGERLFGGETGPDIMAAVLTREIHWDKVPPRVQRLLRCCLERDPKKRLRDIGDFAMLLDEAASPASPPPVERHWPARTAIAILAALVIALGVVLWHGNPSETHSLMRFNADLGPEVVDDAGNGSTVSLSPDGTRLAFTVSRGGTLRIATRQLDQPIATVLAGTENAHEPFFSPDGKWLGFFAEGKLKKISVQGGPAVTLCDVPAARGASWGTDGYIVTNLTLGSGLYRVPEGGGNPQRLTNPAATGEATHRWPQVLPGGQAVLFTGHAVTANYDEANIEVLSLKTGQWKIVQRGGTFGRYVPTGHLLYVSKSILYAVRFDLNRLEVRGAPVPLLDDVADNRGNGNGQFDARNGTLVYVSNRSLPKSWPVEWIDSNGDQQTIPVDPGRYSAPHVSPDGTRLVFAAQQGGGGGDIVVYDLKRQSTTRLTFTGNNTRPVWAPDGKHIVFVTESPRSLALRWIRADGAGEARTLLEDRNEMDPWSFSPDGHLAFAWIAADAAYHIWTLPLDLNDPDNPKPGAPQPFLRTNFFEMSPAFSPDGRWIAYHSGESAAPGIYVRPFPPGPGAASAQWLIASDGNLPVWSPSSPELFFERDGQIMAVSYTASKDSFSAGKARPWSNKPFPPIMGGCCDTWHLDVSRDGKRFLIFAMPQALRGTQRSVGAEVLLNFFSDLKRRVP